jgi:competence protein ComEC
MMLCYQVFLRLFSLSKNLRLRFDVRRLALFPALVFSFFYLAIAGMPVSGVRSFVMITFAVVIYAIDAKPRIFASVLFSGFILLTLMPHELFFASFQLSFLAVLSFGLVVDSSYKIKNFLLKYCYSIVKSSLIITLVTVPVVIYHFGGISLISPLANIVVIPLLTFVIMPFGLMYFILTIIPIKLWLIEYSANIMIESIKAMLSSSEFLANFNLSFLALKDMPLLAVFLILGGILFVFIVKSFLKVFGLIVVVAGLVIFVFNQTPDIIANANSFVFREGNQYYIIGKKEGFAQSIWRSKLGLSNDFLDGEKFCNDDGICMTNKITYVREDSKLKKVNKERCTDILVSRVDVYNLKKLDCKYKVIITRDALEEKPYVVLRYSEVKKA